MTAADLELYVPRSTIRARAVERRDPTAATQSLVYTSPGMAQVPEWDAATAHRFGYIANVVAFRCVQILADAATRIPLRVGRRYRDANTIIDDHPLARLLGPPPGGPAPKLSARRLLAWTHAQQLVAGRRAWEIETAAGDRGGQPVAFWPLVAAHLDAEPSTGGTEWFKVFRYGRSDQKRTLQPDQVFYGWDPAGLDFRQAESPLQSARFDLSMVVAADRYSISFLRNGAVPAAVVTRTAFDDPEHQRRFEQQWNAEHRGIDNAGRTAFAYVGDDGDGPVGDSIDVKILGLSQKDARLAELRKDALMEIAIALGVPWSKLDASGRTFDNAEAEERTFLEDRVVPFAEDFEDDLNMQVTPRFGDVVAWLDLDAVPALRKGVTPITQTVGAPSLVQAQLMTINEARADYGLAPVDGGDRFMTAEEIVALGGVTSETGARAALVELEVRGAGGDTVGGDIALPVADVGGAPPAPPLENRQAEDPEIRRSRIWRTADAVVRTLEARWERSMARLFERQQRSTLARLRGKRGRQATRDPAGPVDPAQVFDPAFWREETAELATDLYEATVVAGGERVTAMFGIAFDLAAPWVDELISGRANQLAGFVTDTTYEAITSQLVEGVAAGESIDDLAKRITTVFADATSRRSTVIARTEVISAYNGSAVAFASTLPADVIGAQEWIATRDGRVRPAHAAADGQIVAMGAAFDVGGDQLAYPGDPNGAAKNTVQCRCTVAFLTPEEAAEVLGRAPARVEVRRAARVLRMVNESTDLLALRAVLREEAAA